jgi:hypothetical protein
MNYWIFQGNPEAYYFDTSINQGLLNGWNVKKHIDKIKQGDKAIIWLCGKSAGCYGLADILSSPYEHIRDSEDLHLWNANNQTGDRHQKEDKITKVVNITLTHNLFAPGKHVPKDHLPPTKGPLETLRKRGFIQGTNFSSTKEQYDIILQLIENRR